VEEVQWDDDLALWAAEDDRHFPGGNYTFLSIFFKLLGTKELKGVKIGISRSKCPLPCPTIGALPFSAALVFFIPILTPSQLPLDSIFNYVHCSS
jgi:hypothetical protein